ncbi:MULTISPECIES: DUF6907 domain-containing protein [unclassified Streptomyces]|uniref:DUF6907 domain-containing protein n=1 Tax=unclassified Streptomyces TaxID=2593676 RepID=UPI002E28B393|nr:hypothetical protein [Streptomyces sp. NBC_00223]
MTDTATHTTAPPAPVPAARTWTLTTTGGHTLTGHLPAWADDDPSESGIPLELLGTRLADISHRTTFPGQTTHVVLGSAPAQEAKILWATIDCHPYADDPDPRTPVASIALVDDYWLTHLTPDDLTHIATQLRTQADRLDHDVKPRLIAAREDWAAHHAG